MVNLLFQVTRILFCLSFYVLQSPRFLQKNEEYAASPKALSLHDPHRTAGRQPHRFICRTALGKNLDQQQFAARDGHFCSLARQHFIADAVLVITGNARILQRIFGVCDRHTLRLSAEIE